jgi:molybdopterin-synthase adenylyltransferase
MTHGEDRYARHRVIPEIGDAGQEKISAATALIVGCGALGSIQSQLLVRAGVGRVRIADNDVAERVNLQRQILFDEDDIAAKRPKAEIAARKLARVNPEVDIEGIVSRVTAENIESLISGVDIIIDACDNFATRYLINDASVKNKVPWIYGGVIGTTGMCLPVVPGQGPCMRCVFPLPPEPGSTPTGVEAGILSSAPAAVGAIQCAFALHLLVEGRLEDYSLAMLDLWNGSLRTVDVARDLNCPACGLGRYEFSKTRITATC